MYNFEFKFFELEVIKESLWPECIERRKHPAARTRSAFD